MRLFWECADEVTGEKQIHLEKSLCQKKHSAWFVMYIAARNMSSIVALRIAL